jgi:hypothetical protein
VTLPSFVVDIPSDGVGIGAVVLGVLALGVAAFFQEPCRKLAARVPTRAWVGGFALLAALLSAGYVVHYLRGGPRIVDAASYFLQARGIAEGKLAFDVPDPSGSFRGRFLVSAPDGRLSVLFPPGYPLVLSLGFLLGAPLAVGPLLAGLLVFATYALTRALVGREDIARLAAVLSALCAALRYHTADTMSHGVSALLLAATLTFAVRATALHSHIAGLAAGVLFATRPVTGMVAVLLGAFLCAREHPSRVIRFGATLLPGFALLALHQHAATGSFFSSTQLYYYALSDTPPGCFSYGFGAGIGCYHEHGDFVRAHLANGYGAGAALGTTLRRLSLHVIDLANFAPFVLLLPYALIRHFREPGVRALGLGVIGIIAAYAPFYFDGNYPGGGARFYADAFPLEHALLALGLADVRLARFAPGLCLLGFAFNAVNGHDALRARDGGRPMFDASILAEKGIDSGLVFVDTDNGFSIGHDPGTDPQRGVLVARFRGDAHDYALFQRLGRPRAYRYRHSFRDGQVRVEPYLPSPVLPSAAPLRYELESQWPPLAVERGSAYPTYTECLSRGTGLRLRVDESARVAVTVDLTPPEPGDYELAVGWMAESPTTLRVSLGGHAFAPINSAPDCSRHVLGLVRLAGTERIVLRAEGGSPILDYIELQAVDSKRR